MIKMFFWKFTRSGKYSTKYISLIIDIHESRIIDGQLNLSFLECQDIMMLIHDVETLNSKNNYSAGLLKKPFQEQVPQMREDV